MNKTPVAVALSAAAYSLLFFEENAGINFFLFTLLVVVLLFWSKPVLKLDRKFIFFATLSLFSAFSILLYGSDLAIFANVVSLLVLCAAAVAPEASVINNFLHGLFSVVSSAILSGVEFFTKKKQAENIAGRRLSNVITYIVPLFIGLVFLAIYRQANPLFERFTGKLNLDFISLKWVMFTLGGVIFCSGIFLLKRQPVLDKLETNLDGALDASTPSMIWNQKNAFMVLLILLNLMALIINGLDIKYLYLGAGLPEGITHKQFVHNGVGNLILSILLGIITLIYFLQRTERNKLINGLVFFWMGQNFLIVLSTAMRNNMYIQEALLTYLRIGVYYWLFMASVGLTTTILKIRNRKNTWYLFRVNSLVALTVLVLSTAIDWDFLISVYNVKNRGSVASLDKKYMLSISEGNLALLYSLRDDEGFNTDSVWHYSYWNGSKNKKLLDAKLYRFYAQNQGTDWRSFNFRRARVYREMEDLKIKGMFRHLSIVDVYPKPNPEIFGFFPDVSWLEIPSLPEGDKIEHLNKLKQLDTLSLKFIGLDDTVQLRKLQHVHVIEHHTDLKENQELQAKVPRIRFRRVEDNE